MTETQQAPTVTRRQAGDRYAYYINGTRMSTSKTAYDFAVVRYGNPYHPSNWAVTYSRTLRGAGQAAMRRSGTTVVNIQS